MRKLSLRLEYLLAVAILCGLAAIPALLAGCDTGTHDGVPFYRSRHINLHMVGFDGVFELS